MNKGFITNCLKISRLFKADLRVSNLTSKFALFHVVRFEVNKIPNSLRKHSFNIVKMCARQCECVIAHRIRRGQQIISLYSRYWNEIAVRIMVNSMKYRLRMRSKEFLLSIVGATVFNWEKDRIPDEDILSHMKEFQFVHELMEKTVTCPDCKKRQVIDVPSPDISYCQCPAKGCYRKAFHESSWVPFLERKDLLIWRQDHNGQYAYKLYGSYNDVTAKDFLQVQIDADYRQEWDETALDLRIVESDPNSNSDIVYWEMEWPRLFTNRDYVFNRRYVIDSKKKMIVIVSRSAEHVQCPEKEDKHRVKEYWSYMIIKAHTSFDEPGIEFSLTYFDNSGTSIPTYVASWVAMTGLPDFMAQLRKAAKDFHHQRTNVKPLLDRDIKFQKHSGEKIRSSDEKVASSTSSQSPSPQEQPIQPSYFSNLYGYRLFT